MFNTIKADRMAAMKRRDKKTTSLLGLVISDAQRKQNETDKSVVKIIQVMIKNVRECLDNVDAGSLKAQEMVNEIAILEPYLPQPFTGAELKKEIYSVFGEIENPSMRDMGFIMKRLNTIANERNLLIDGKEVKTYVQEFINPS